MWELQEQIWEWGKSRGGGGVLHHDVHWLSAPCRPYGSREEARNGGLIRAYMKKEHNEFKRITSIESPNNWFNGGAHDTPLGTLTLLRANLSVDTEIATPSDF